MAEIKRLYRPGEFRHWFDTETLVFFRTVLPGVGVKTDHGNYFVTQETNPSGVVGFSVRRQDPDNGNIQTVGEFHSHSCYAAATNALRTHLITVGKLEVAHAA
jgi:hypothetical protein